MGTELFYFVINPIRQRDKGARRNEVRLKDKVDIKRLTIIEINEVLCPDGNRYFQVGVKVFNFLI